MAEAEPVGEGCQVAGLVAIGVGAARRPRALAMAAHIQRDDMEAVAEMPGEAVERVGAAGIAVHADERRRRRIAPIEVVQLKTVYRDPLARRLAGAVVVVAASLIGMSLLSCWGGEKSAHGADGGAIR